MDFRLPPENPRLQSWGVSNRENRITNNEYNILRDYIDEAENKIETLLPIVQSHIDELEDIAKNARRALRGMF